MNRDQFWLVLDKVARVLPAEVEVVVIGSQAAHAWINDLPDEVSRSREVDVATLDDPNNEKAMRVNWVMGELSEFDEEHDVYAEGVGIDLFDGPTGWIQRAKALEVPRADGSVLQVLCPGLPDLCVAKVIAGREQDEQFVAALARDGEIELDWVAHLLTGTEADTYKVNRARDTITHIRRSMASAP